MHIMARGFTTGLVAAGYGLGTFFTSFPIDSMIKSPYRYGDRPAS
jgi:hypothetical protein